MAISPGWIAACVSTFVATGGFLLFLARLVQHFTRLTDSVSGMAKSVDNMQHDFQSVADDMHHIRDKVDLQEKALTEMKRELWDHEGRLAKMAMILDMDDRAVGIVNDVGRLHARRLKDGNR